MPLSIVTFNIFSEVSSKVFFSSPISGFSGFKSVFECRLTSSTVFLGLASFVEIRIRFFFVALPDVSVSSLPGVDC